MNLVLYRYVRDYEYRYNPAYGFVDYDQPYPIIALRKFLVKRETKKCYVIELINGKEKYVLKYPLKKAYAYSCKEKAMKSFRKRTLASLDHSERDVNLAKEFLKLIDSE